MARLLQGSNLPCYQQNLIEDTRTTKRVCNGNIISKYFHSFCRKTFILHFMPELQCQYIKLSHASQSTFESHCNEVASGTKYLRYIYIRSRVYADIGRKNITIASMQTKLKRGVNKGLLQILMARRHIVVLIRIEQK